MSSSGRFSQRSQGTSSEPTSEHDSRWEAAPLKSAALAYPLFTTIILILAAESFWKLGIPVPAAAAVSLLVGVLEIGSAGWIRETRESPAMEIRRQVVGVVLIAAGSLLLSRSSLPTAALLFLLLLIQWLFSGMFGRMGAALPILQRYAAGRVGYDLIGSMREISSEAGEFFRECRLSRVYAAGLIGIQCFAAASLSFASVPVPPMIVPLLFVSITLHLILGLLISQLADRQHQRIIGIRTPKSQEYLRLQLGLAVLAVGMGAATLIASNRAILPPGVIIGWLQRIRFPAAPAVPEILPAMPQGSPIIRPEILDALPDVEPGIRLDLLFRFVGLLAALSAAAFVLKPFFQMVFYSSVRAYHPLARLIAGLRRLLREGCRILAGLLHIRSEFGSTGAKDSRERELGNRLQSAFGTDRMTRSKRRQLNRIIGALVRLISTAERRGIRYRFSRAPGEFLELVAARLDAFSPTEELCDQASESAADSYRREDLLKSRKASDIRDDHADRTTGDALEAREVHKTGMNSMAREAGEARESKTCETGDSHARPKDRNSREARFPIDQIRESLYRLLYSSEELEAQTLTELEENLSTVTVRLALFDAP